MIGGLNLLADCAEALASARLRCRTAVASSESSASSSRVSFEVEVFADALVAGAFFLGAGAFVLVAGASPFPLEAGAFALASSSVSPSVGERVMRFGVAYSSSETLQRMLI